MLTLTLKTYTMGTMSSKHADLQALNALIVGGQTLACIQFLGTPIGDGHRLANLSDERYKIVLDVADLRIGDLAYSGNMAGVVTNIFDDGAATPVRNRVEVTYPEQIMQSPDDTTPEPRVIIYNLISNSDADSLNNEERLMLPNPLLSAGVVFMSNIFVASGVLSIMSVSANVAAANGVDAVTVSVSSIGSDGSPKNQGGDTVVISATLSAVVGAVSDNGDGTYSADVTDAVAETSVVTATINGDNVGAPDSENIVFS